MPSAVVWLLALWLPRGLPIELRAQQTMNWCWAASGEMAMDYLHPERVPGDSFAQSNQASRRGIPTHDGQLGGTPVNCPGDRCLPVDWRWGIMPRACEPAGYPDFSSFGFEGMPTTPVSSLTWSALRAEIYCRRPVAVEWRYSGGSHMAIAAAQSRIAGEPFVRVFDPEPKCWGDTRHEAWDYFSGRLAPRVGLGRVYTGLHFGGHAKYGSQADNVQDVARMSCRLPLWSFEGNVQASPGPLAVVRRLLDWSAGDGLEQETALDDLGISRSELLSQSFVPTDRIQLLTIDPSSEAGAEAANELKCRLDPDRIAVPMDVDGTVRSLVVTRKIAPGAWRLESFGYRFLASQAMPATEGTSCRRLLFVPALNLSFAVRGDNTVQLLVDGTELDLDQKQPLNWPQTRTRLQNYLAQHQHEIGAR